MKSKSSSDPWRLALLNALLIAGFYMLICVISFWFYPVLPWFLILSTLAVFVFSFFILRFTLEKFIYNKIRIIYKTIRKQKLAVYSTRGSKEAVRLDAVEKEVEQWTQQQKQEIEELKKMEQYRREFLGNISHELKTPIFNIQGYILTLLEGGIDDPAINKEYLLRTEKSIDRMINIVEDLEIISHLESGELKLHYSSFDIVHTSEDVIEMLHNKALQYNIEILLTAPHHKPIFVQGDREKIIQVLTNLVDNSLKYGKTGGQTRISCYDMDESVLIEVADNGIGIEEHNLTRLFERFFRADKGRSRDEGGSGLGLAIVKHILEAHGQAVHVRSTPGMGTTFGFTLEKSKV
jgi:two-component system phosphate regulon sensor histidine kinase PhoR